jgi:hypothetical protein
VEHDDVQGLMIAEEQLHYMYINEEVLYTRWEGHSNSVTLKGNSHGPGIESRWGARFFAHVQTGPGAHPASCTMGTGSFPGVKRPGRGADHPTPPSAEIENEYSYTSRPLVACYRATKKRK